MAESVTKLQVFISGPGDTLREQQLVARTIRSMNQSQMKHLGITLQSLSWREDLRADFGIYAQDVVNKQFGDDWDIYVGVLWARHGTPTPKAQSGTEEEFNLAYERWKADFTSCKVAVFFSEVLVSPSADAEQLQKVQAFRQRVESLGGVYTTFADSEDFVFKIRDYLSDVTSSYGRDWGATSLKPVGGPSYPSGRPSIGSLSFSEMNVIQLGLAAASTLAKFMLVLYASRAGVRRITRVMQEQAALPVPQTEAETRIWSLAIRKTITEAFVQGSIEVEVSLPKVREAWGDLSAMLFKLLSHPELDDALTLESAQTISSKIALMTPAVNESRRPLARTIESFENASFVPGYSRRKLTKALKALDNEYAFIADECKDLDTFFQRRVEALS